MRRPTSYRSVLDQAEAAGRESGSIIRFLRQIAPYFANASRLNGPPARKEALALEPGSNIRFPPRVSFAASRPYIASVLSLVTIRVGPRRPTEDVIIPLRILHKYRRTATSIIYASIAAASYSLAFLLRFDFVWPATYTGLFLWSSVLLIAVRVGFALATRLGIGSWRYVGLRDLLRLTLAATAGFRSFLRHYLGPPVHSACAPLRHRDGVAAHG